jgi:hypothetical protein
MGGYLFFVSPKKRYEKKGDPMSAPINRGAIDRSPALRSRSGVHRQAIPGLTMDASAPASPASARGSIRSVFAMLGAARRGRKIKSGEATAKKQSCESWDTLFFSRLGLARCWNVMKTLVLVLFVLCVPPTFADRFSDYLAPIAVPQGGNPVAAQKRINDFIWSHWSSRSKSGFLEATFYSKEGERVTIQAVVGPDSNKVWRLAVTPLRQFAEPSCFVAINIERRVDEKTQQNVLALISSDGRTIATW